jgi:hypothetical protein
LQDSSHVLAEENQFDEKEVKQMYCSDFFGSSWYWLWPVLMIAVCFFMMRRWRGPMMCGFGSRYKGWPHYNTSDSAIDILEKR